MKWPQRKHLLSREERWKALQKALFNVFYLPSEAVYFDLLTDSGTVRMSRAQWNALDNGDESYAGSQSARKLKRTIKELFDVPYVLLVHQGRAAENVFGNVMQKEPGLLVLGNTPFDTTRMHIESRGGIIIDCTATHPIPPMIDPDAPQRFLGNVDILKLDAELWNAKKENRKIAYILITATCNSNASQPVSLRNIRDVCQTALKHKVPVFMDLARYAQNAYFIKHYEGHSNLSIAEIVRAMTKMTDGFLVSGKKDALGSMGGFIGLRSPELCHELMKQVIMMEGLDLQKTDPASSFEDEVGGYGGMSGRDMEALSQGIKESTDDQRLGAYLGQIQWLAKELFNIGVPVLPPGGTGVFVDAGAFLPHLRWDQFPGHALALALYLEGGIRSVEIGSLILGRDPATGQNRRAPQELCRLAIPRYVYNNKQLSAVVKTFKRLKSVALKIAPVQIVTEREPRHFSAGFSWEGIK